MSGYAEMRCGPFKLFDLARFPHRGREAEAHDLLFFASPESRHQENARSDAGFTQGDRFVERSDSQPAGSCLFKRSCALDRSMAVGICFYDGANRNPDLDVPLEDSEVVPQVG
jgi:hypothetical protein